ncbi:hypothetical protein PC120_g25789 [Phytophthora cactorum]|nr:hypothetical protein PC120_g25789 [Phytophthora cactorum]
MVRTQVVARRGRVEELEDDDRRDDDSSDSDYDFWDQVDEDPREELEPASYIPLDRIKLFSGRRSRSDNSMQWLKTFALEMKGTRTLPDEWCAAFELSLRDGAIHWFRQLPKKTRRKWKPLSQAFIDYYCTQYKQSPAARYYPATRERKEHICNYLNRLNGYARNARLQVEMSQRDAKEHVELFLLTCGDDRLMQDLGRLRLNDIRELLMSLLKRENDLSPKALLNSSDRSSRRERRDYDRRDRRDYGRRERHEHDRLREDTRRAPRVTFADAEERDWVAYLNGRGPNTQRASICRDGWSDSEDDVSGAGDLESSCSDGSSSDDSQRQLAATTRVNVGAPLKERTQGQIDASAGTTKQGEATVVNDLPLSAGSVITVAEASNRVWPAVEELWRWKSHVNSSY